MPKKSRLTAADWTERKRATAERQRLARKAWKDSHPRESTATYLPAARLDAQVRRIEPAPWMMTPLLPRPHAFAGLLFAELPPEHPARSKVGAGTLLVWQLSTYARDVHTSYQVWGHVESAQWLASPLIFPTRILARRYLAIRRASSCPDTPAHERGSSGKVYWSPESLAAITPDLLTPFGDILHARPL